MNWFTYLHRTPLAQIRADWAEYIGLWRKSIMLRGLRSAAYDKIVRMVNGEVKENPERSCVLQTYYHSPVNNGNSSSDGLNNMMWISQSVCRHFRESRDGVKCTKSDCPFVARNHEYADACEQYNLTRMARRDFWRVKIVQASQKTK